MEGIAYMAGDRDRLDLSGDLGDLGQDFLKDVKAATEQAKQRKAADKAKEVQDAQRVQSRKISTAVIAIAAAIIFLLSYWVVFGRQGNEAEATGGGTTTTQSAPYQTKGKAMAPPCVTNAAPKAPPKVTPPVGQSSQPAEHAPDDYEQPGSDQGM